MNKVVCLLLIIVCSLLAVPYSYATHNRAGEITYKHIGSDQSLEYEITITTYTKTSSCPPACRPSLDSVHLGDGTITQFLRDSTKDIPGDISISWYSKRHTYPGSGVDTIIFIDPNRNGGVVNVPNSINVPFSIYAIIVISPNIIPRNDSPILLNPPIDSGCVGVPFVHNPVAVDADTSQGGIIIHDSLAYKLVVCRGDGGVPIPGYTLPQTSNFFTLDSITGDLVWDSPVAQGEYNVAFEIQEWRGGILIGVVERDMQIRIIDNCQNHPPIIQNVADTCIMEGDSIHLHVQATDPDRNPLVLTAIGDVFPPLVTSNAATFTTDSRGTNDTVNGLLKWIPNCNQVRRQPYHVEFKAQDTVIATTSASLVNFKGYNVTVVGPGPKTLVAVPAGSGISLHWAPDSCQQVIAYIIYRHQGPFTGTIQCPCQTGAPGFTAIDTIPKTYHPGDHAVNDTTYTDSNHANGLSIGVLYCYAVTAMYPDRAESCVSPVACAKLKKDLPVITNVSVDSTDVTAGKMYVAWSPPDTADLDSSIHQPFSYKLYHSIGFTSSSFSLIADQTDTIFEDTLINTVASPWCYKVAFYYDSLGNRIFKGYSQIASSIYIKLTPTDHKMILNWQENVPWTNSYYDIFRWDSTTLVWDSIGRDSLFHTFSDSGLVNGDTVCYYVRSTGTYGTGGIIDPVINLAQQVCGMPVDNVAPCPPSLTVVADCEDNRNFLQWNNPDNFCIFDRDTDVAKYNIYYAADSTADFILLTTIINANDTTYFHEHLNQLTGCYRVTAVDSNGNESAATAVCVDTCRQYVLPSVFTPNGDDHNDVYHACDSTTSNDLQKKNCPPYKNVKDVDMKIFSRWGELVFETTNKDINWDGKNKYTHGECPAGVYYYTCKVNFFRLKGTETKELHGYIHLIREK